MEAERLMLDDSFIKFEAACCKAVTAAGVAAVKDRHVVLFCHLVDGGEER